MKKFLLGCALISSTVAFADDFKLGYVDVAKIFTTSKPAVAVQQALKLKYAPQQKNLQALNQKLVSEQTQMQALMRTAPDLEKMTPSNRTKLESLNTQYQKDQTVFQQKYMVFQQQLQRAQDYASAKVLAQANTILKSLSDKGGYDLVVTSNQLVYAKPKYDLTDQVIAQLNKMDTKNLITGLDKVENEPLKPMGMQQNPGIKAPVAPVKPVAKANS